MACFAKTSNGLFHLLGIHPPCIEDSRLTISTSRGGNNELVLWASSGNFNYSWGEGIKMFPIATGPFIIINGKPNENHVRELESTYEIEVRI